MELFSSFSILIYLAIGLIIGWFVFPKRWLKANNYMVMIGVALTLFTMGASLGGSPTFFEDMKLAGTAAFVIALFTVIGSVAIVYILTRLFFGGKHNG